MTGLATQEVDNSGSSVIFFRPLIPLFFKKKNKFVGVEESKYNLKSHQGKNKTELKTIRQQSHRKSSSQRQPVIVTTDKQRNNTQYNGGQFNTKRTQWGGVKLWLKDSKAYNYCYWQINNVSKITELEEPVGYRKRPNWVCHIDIRGLTSTKGGLSTSYHGQCKTTEDIHD